MALYAISLEGVVTDIRRVGVNAEIDMMGMTVFIDHTLADAHRITTSSNLDGITINQLADPTPIEGRTEAGFVGGTAIIKGNYNDVTKRLEAIFPPTPIVDGISEAFPSVEIGPPESVLGGPKTNDSGTNPFTVNDVPIKLITGSDPKLFRLPLIPSKNEFGFEIVIDKVPRLSLSTVNGFYSKGANAFIGYEVIVDSNDTTTLTNPTTPQISITKAQSRLRGGLYDVNVRGGVTAFHIGATDPQRVHIFRVDDIPGTGEVETSLGFATARVVAGKPFSKWTFSARLTALPSPLNGAPTRLRAYNESPDAIFANAGNKVVVTNNHVEVIKG